MNDKPTVESLLIPDQSLLRYSASFDTEWFPFTPRHQQALDLTLAIAYGKISHLVAALVGVYGSGKTTLLLTVFRKAIKEGMFAVWDEAAAFVDRLIPAGQRVTPQKFSQLAHEWLKGLQNDRDIRHQYCCDLEERGHSAIANAIRSTATSSKNQIVLLLDEMEQASHLFLERIETADRQPLRAWLDSCLGSGLRILMSYAPESFHSLGDADKGRMRTIHIPSLDATSISHSLNMPKPMANFAWWASRGRARGVLKVRDDIFLPFQQGLFHGSWNPLREALDGLPGIFGVPAVLRESLTGQDLEELLELAPRQTASGETGVTLEIRDRRTVTDQLEQEFATASGRSSHELEAVIQELLEVLDAMSDDTYRCYLTTDDMVAAVSLAEARAIESGKVLEMLEGLAQQAIGVFFRVGIPGQLKCKLPLSLTQLSKIFPSPFTDPSLPLPDLKLPTRSQVEERYFPAKPTDRPVFHSESRACMIFHDIGALDSWLAAGYAMLQSSPKRILLLERGRSSPLVELARTAGLLEYKELPLFSGSFVKSLFILSRQRSNPDDLDDLIADLRRDKHLSRKIDWHVTRLDQELESLRPAATSDWHQAIKVIRTDPFKNVLARLRQGSPGLLALLYPFKAVSEANRKVLSQLAETLDSTRPLRKLPIKHDTQSRLEGAAVVVDILPGTGGRKRWVESDFPGRNELGQILAKFGGIEHDEILAALLYPDEPERLKAFIEFNREQLPSIGSERQELNALKGLAKIRQRRDKVHAGISRLVGDKRAIQGAFFVGNLIEAAWQADKELGQLQEIGAEASKLKAPWAKTLALWICGVFAERIQSGVESEEASLQEWEELAREGESVGKQVEKVIQEIREADFPAIADSLRREQRELRKYLDSPDALRHAIEELKRLIKDYERLRDSLIDFRSVCTQLGIQLEILFSTYCPRPEDIGKSYEQLERVLHLVKELEESAPAPTDPDLATYLSRLERYAQESRTKRLQGRLAQAIQADVVHTVRISAEDMDQIELLWRTLEPTFQNACRQAVEQSTEVGTDMIVHWIKEAYDKQTRFSHWMHPEDERLRTLDERIHAWATSVEVRPAVVTALTQDRNQIRQLFSNYPLRDVEEKTLQHFIDLAKQEAPGTIYSSLVSASQHFVQELENRLNELRELLSGEEMPKSLLGDTPEEVLRCLTAKLSEAKQELKKLRDEIQELNSVLGSLEVQLDPVPSPLSLSDARELARRAQEKAREALNKRQAQLKKELKALRLPSALMSDSAHQSLQEEVDSYFENHNELEQARKYIKQLDQLGATRDTVQGVDWQSVLGELKAEVTNTQLELDKLCKHIEVLRRRVGGLDDRADLFSEEPLTNLSEACNLVKKLTVEIARLRQHRLKTASVEAQDLYVALSQTPLIEEDERFAPIFELWKLGLLKTVEDEL